MAGLVLPLHATSPEAALLEVGLRAVTFVALALLLDGRLEPAR
jgi:hypothetical protein